MDKQKKADDGARKDQKDSTQDLSVTSSSDSSTHANKKPANSEDDATASQENHSAKEKPIGLPQRIWNAIFIPDHTNAIIAIFNILLFVATSVYATFAILQWNVTRQSLRVDQRAWLVNFTDNNIHLVVNEPITKNFVALRNTGKTPARDASFYYRMDVVNKDDVPNFDLSGKIPSHMGARIVYPGEGGKGTTIGLLTEMTGTHAVTPVLLTQEVQDKFNRGEIIFLTYGKAEYSDAFQVRHWTTFCASNYMVSQFTPVASQAIVKRSQYNDSDDEGE